MFLSDKIRLFYFMHVTYIQIHIYTYTSIHYTNEASNSNQSIPMTKTKIDRFLSL